MPHASSGLAWSSHFVPSSQSGCGSSCHYVHVSWAWGGSHAKTSESQPSHQDPGSPGDSFFYSLGCAISSLTLIGWPLLRWGPTSFQRTNSTQSIVASLQSSFSLANKSFLFVCSRNLSQLRLWSGWQGLIFVIIMRAQGPVLFRHFFLPQLSLVLNTRVSLKDKKFGSDSRLIPILPHCTTSLCLSPWAIIL